MHRSIRAAYGEDPHALSARVVALVRALSTIVHGVAVVRILVVSRSRRSLVFRPSLFLAKNNSDLELMVVWVGARGPSRVRRRHPRRVHTCDSTRTPSVYDVAVFAYLLVVPYIFLFHFGREKVSRLYFLAPLLSPPS